MATVEQCRQAIESVAARLATEPAPRDVDRSFTCHVNDLGVDFRGRLAGGTIVGLSEGADPQADVRLRVSGDDLLALVDGSLNLGRAWASGRLSVHAPFRDLLRLRRLV